MAIDKSKMKCNSPKRQVQGGKKFVVKACKDGKEKIIRYGDANMRIKKATQPDGEVFAHDITAIPQLIK
jgi:hypothetical protein